MKRYGQGRRASMNYRYGGFWNKSDFPWELTDKKKELFRLLGMCSLFLVYFPVFVVMLIVEVIVYLEKKTSKWFSFSWKQK